MNQKKLKQAKNTLQALDRKYRFKIIKHLADNYPEEVPFMDIVFRAGVRGRDYPTISNALSQLRKLQIITVRKQGKYNFYKLNMPRMITITNAINELVSHEKETTSNNQENHHQTNQNQEKSSTQQAQTRTAMRIMQP